MTEPECSQISDTSNALNVARWFGSVGLNGIQSFIDEAARTVLLIRPPEHTDIKAQISASDGVQFLASHGVMPILPHIGTRR